MDSKKLTYSVLAIILFFGPILNAQETLQSVTEEGNITDQRIILNSGAEVSKDNLVIDGTAIEGKAPLSIIGNQNSEGISILNGAIRFENTFSGTSGDFKFGPFSDGNPFFESSSERTLLKISNPGSTLGESAIQLMGAGANSESVYIYNNSSSESSYGIRLDKSLAGEFKPFQFEFKDETESYPVFTLMPDKSSYFHGNVGIGTTDTKGNKLAVAGTILAESATVKLQENWPDYVFLDSYKLKSLEELKRYIAEHGKLPNIPSAAQVEKEGIDLGEMNGKLLEKVEELTLYVIQQQEDIEEVNTTNEELKMLLEQLKEKQ